MERQPQNIPAGPEQIAQLEQLQRQDVVAKAPGDSFAVVRLMAATGLSVGAYMETKSICVGAGMFLLYVLVEVQSSVLRSIIGR